MDDQDQDTESPDLTWRKRRLPPPRREWPLKNRSVHGASLAFRSHRTNRVQLFQPISDVKESYENLTGYNILRPETRRERIANAVTLAMGAAFSVGLIVVVCYELILLWP